MTRINLEEIMATRLGSLDPSRFPDDIFDLYSVPAFDQGQPETLSGSKIGSSKQIVQSGDVLLSRIVPHIRRAWIVGPNRGRRQIASGEWIVFRSPRIHPPYLRYQLITDRFHAHFMQTVSGVGGSLLRARPAQVADIEIDLPSAAEQEVIALQLQKADQVRQTRRYALQLCDEFFPATFAQLLERHREDCNLAELGDFLVFVTSGSRGWAEYYAPTGARFIRSLDVRMNHISDDDAVFVNPPKNAEAERTWVQPEDVLLTITGSRIGRVAPAAPRLAGAFISQHVAILRLNSNLSPRYLAAYISLQNFGQREVARLQYGQTKPGLNLDQIREMRVIVPSTTVQTKFIEALDGQERLRATHEESLRQADHLFQTLLHQTFA